MRTSTIIIAGILAATVSAQDVPASCTRAAQRIQGCAPANASTEDFASPDVANCLCTDDSFDDDILNCIADAGSLIPDDAKSTLEAFQGYCALLGGGGSGGSPTSEPTTDGLTSTPTADPTGSGSQNCDYFLEGFSSCWTDGSTPPTAAPVADCLCSVTSFDAAVEGCYSDLVDSSPMEASSIQPFVGFCSSYSEGAFGGSSPTGTDGSSDPSSTGMIDSPNPTTEDAPTTSGRVIQTLEPAGTSTTGSGPRTTSSSTSSNNNGGTNPNGAAGLKLTLFGTALAALVAGAALVL